MESIAGRNISAETSGVSTRERALFAHNAGGREHSVIQLDRRLFADTVGRKSDLREVGPWACGLPSLGDCEFDANADEKTANSTINPFPDSADIAHQSGPACGKPRNENVPQRTVDIKYQAEKHER